MKERIEEFKALLGERLHEDRYYHSLCVMEEAERLAEKYGADVEKATVAGLLHDITKNEPDAVHKMIFEKGNIPLDEVSKCSRKLYHAISGAYVIEHDLGITDKDILNAVRYHTTAHENMSLLEKIIYMADFISADRTYDGVDELRKTAYTSLEDAMEVALAFSINELVEKGAMLHLDTVKAWNCEMQNRKDK